MTRDAFVCAAVLFSAVSLSAQEPAPALTRTAVSAPLTDIRYEVAFTRTMAQERRVRVSMTFRAQGSAPVLLSLPAWTPGAYEISNFARFVVNFAAHAGGREFDWDKLDYDTWRIERDAAAEARGPVTVTFDFRADTLDNAMSWTQPDFLLFNGTNLFLFPEGQSPTFASRVSVSTEPGWKITTALPRVAGTGPATFTAANYHDLVDSPFFIGHFDLDSALVAGKWMRLATYPAGSIQGALRQQAWDQLKKATPPLVAVFGDVPWDTYTVQQILDSTFRGASGLEHANSHVDIFSPPFIGSDFQPSLYAHEIAHAWNVKRLRPAGMVPYRYDRPMPTPWLWMSEGITDYYADLALVRGGIISDTGFYAVTSDKINETIAAGPIALEDASLNTWIDPLEPRYVYYPKGAVAGLLLDIMIRDASDNRRSLDNVMRELYEGTYKQNGRGFTDEDWWGAVSRAANGRSFADFERRYIDGREPFPLRQLLPLAGLKLDPLRVPRIGITTQQDAAGIHIVAVEPASMAEAIGVRAGDYLLAINELSVTDQTFGEKFRAMFDDAQEGQPLTLALLRAGQQLQLRGALRLVEVGVTVSADPGAGAKALRIRNGILRGATDR